MVRRARIAFVFALALVGFAGCITEPWVEEMPAATGATALALGWSETAAWPDRGHDVYGLRLGASSRHHSVAGVDVNAIGVTDAASAGFALALVRNEARDDFYGVQLALG